MEQQVCLLSPSRYIQLRQNGEQTARLDTQV